jgi:hypothetical protein
LLTAEASTAQARSTHSTPHSRITDQKTGLVRYESDGYRCVLVHMSTSPQAI